MKKKKLKIFVAGHNGLVGSAIVRYLKLNNYENIIVVDKKKLDLINQKQVNIFLKNKKPDAIIISAAKVGGIKINNNKTAEFIYENLMIQSNLIHGAYKMKVKNLVFLGSSCIYPKYCKQPIKEKYLLSGSLEKTNEAYAIAKISGLKMCEYYNQQYGTNFKSLMPTNSFGPNDNYNLDNSHFLPALIRKIYEAKVNKKTFIELWGNGKSKRELVHVNDLASACVYFLFKDTKNFLINVGSGKDYSIIYYAKKIMKILDVDLKIKYINKNLIGTPRKILDTTLAKNLGWKAKISLDAGLNMTIKDFVKNYKKYT